MSSVAGSIPRKELNSRTYESFCKASLMYDNFIHSEMRLFLTFTFQCLMQQESMMMARREIKTATERRKSERELAEAAADEVIGD